jgi:hypothetical protein
VKQRATYAMPRRLAASQIEKQERYWFRRRTLALGHPLKPEKKRLSKPGTSFFRHCLGRSEPQGPELSHPGDESGRQELAAAFPAQGTESSSRC